MQKIHKKLFDIQCKDLVFKKEAENPFFKSKYLTLEALLTELKPVLKEYNLLITHSTHSNCVVTSVIDVESGEFVSSAFPLQDGIDPQKVGSAITYGKRYNLSQIFNIIADEDDDGNKASTARTASTESDFDLAMGKVKNTKWTDTTKKEAIVKIQASTLYDEAEKFEIISAINGK